MKEITGYEGFYSISTEGVVWSHGGRKGAKREGRVLKSALVGNGYKLVMLYRGKYKHFLVHRLVAQAFLPNPKNLREVNHRNGDRLDNRVENLEWVSSQENKRHALKQGFYKNICKLSPSQIKEIRLQHASGIKQSELAKIYNVTGGAISHIICRRTWAYL